MHIWIKNGAIKYLLYYLQSIQWYICRLLLRLKQKKYCEQTPKLCTEKAPSLLQIIKMFGSKICCKQYLRVVKTIFFGDYMLALDSNLCRIWWRYLSNKKKKFYTRTSFWSFSFYDRYMQSWLVRKISLQILTLSKAITRPKFLEDISSNGKVFHTSTWSWSFSLYGI